MKKKKIYLIVSSSCGGAERMTLLYGKILSKSGFDCRLLVYQNRKKKFILKPFIPEDMPYDLICCSDKLLYFHLYNSIKRFRPDIIFCSQPVNTKRILILRKLGLVNAKVIFRDFLMPSNQNLKKRKSNTLLSSADALIAQTNDMKNEMISFYECPEFKIKTIVNPIDKLYINKCIKETTPLNPNNINFVAMNRIAPQKDILTMLEAFAICKKNIPNSHLYILGDNTDKDYIGKINNWISYSSIQDSVHILGLQENPYRFLKAADVFVMSSLYEGLPNAMLEAMYLGIPVAVTRSIPFIEQTVEEGKTGFTVDPANPQKLAVIMQKATKLKNLTKYQEVSNSEDEIIKLFSEI